MNYCTKNQWVVITTTGQIGIVDIIEKRRDHKGDGIVWVQCGAGGPFVKANMGWLRECTVNEIKEAEGVM